MKDTAPDAQRAWSLRSGLYLAGSQIQWWAIEGEITVISLRSEDTDYSAASARVVREERCAFPYRQWSPGSAAAVLHGICHRVELAAARGPVLVHSTNGINRTGLVGLALLMRSGMPLAAAYVRYDARGVPRPHGFAGDVARAYARRLSAL